MERKRQLNDNEKQEIIDEHGRMCFVDGAPIADDESIEFHHINAFSKGGQTSLGNIAAVCKSHHRTIGTMGLQEYRDKIELAQFFEGGQPIYLDDLILFKQSKCCEKIKYETSGDRVVLYSKNQRSDYPLYTCPTTGWKYFYATIPVENIGNDRALQPRTLREPSLWNLYRHFQSSTQLSPSIGRIDEDGKLLLFDGQHKAAAQIWSGRSMIECKIYLNPDPTILKETNLEAHGKFRQMSFYSHELMKKYADIFGEEWDQYMETEGEKSETGFFNFLINTKRKTKAKARAEVLLALYNEIIDAPDNKLTPYQSDSNSSRTGGETNIS